MPPEIPCVKIYERLANEKDEKPNDEQSEEGKQG
jgi:hypothetical protein